MTAGIFKEVLQTASRMGSCEPRWLHEGTVPQFECAETGDHGPNMILLHGLFGAMSNWDSTVPLFSKFAKVFNLSFPLLTGHRSEVRVKALAAYTEFFIRSRNLAPVVLCGNSLGGHVALRLSLAAPELIDCMVLAGASGLYEHSVDTLPIRPDKTFVRDHMGRVFKNPALVTDEAVDEIHGILTSRLKTLNLIHAARSAKKDNLLTVLPQIKVPTLLVWGEDDEVTTMQVAETFHKSMPNSKLVTIGNCGHAPMIEHPDWFSAQVETFLQEKSKFYKK